MELKEVGMVLARISNFDNRRLDQSVARDWKIMLDRELHGRGTVEAAMEVVLDHFALPQPPYFTVGLLVQGLKERFRLTPKAIKDDVSSAKARGMVAKDWPRDAPIPVDVAEALERFRAEARELAPAIEGPNVPGVELEVGRTV